MSKAVLISVQPKWCELIANGKKTVEVRKTRPKIEPPFKCYIYYTKDKHGWFDFLKKTRLEGKVIGEFLCDSIMPYCRYDIVSGVSEVGFEELPRATQLSRKELYDYCGEKDIYCWHISDLVIYDKPKELSEFRSYNVRAYLENGHPMPTHEMKRPPQSWCYVEELKGGVSDA